jgi:peptide/nickel transport system substrate-binding protein
MRLKEPFPFVEMALASSSGMVPAIMRAKDAATDPFQMVTETVGSGPFRFVRAEWVPGVKLVYEKNPDYVPRAEPPDGLAGGKVVKVDRMEWIVLPDPMTKASALQKGEIDIIDQLPLDQVPLLAKVPGVTIGRVNPVDNTGIIRPNHLVPPFDNPPTATIRNGGANAGRSSSAAPATRPMRVSRPCARATSRAPSSCSPNRATRANRSCC